MATEFETRIALEARVGLAGITACLNQSYKPSESPCLEKLQVLYGNSKVELGELFKVTVKGPENDVHWSGNTGMLDDLARGLNSGKWFVHGDCGDRAGQGMTGGRLEIHGTAGCWIGCEGQGGQILVRGDVGDYAGAAAPGMSRGINGSCIIVNGNAGAMAGRRMRRGLLAISGNVGQGTGWQMLAGTIVAGQQINGPVGQGMKRGTIIALDESAAGNAGDRQVAPDSFYRGIATRQASWPLIQQYLARNGFPAAKCPGDLSFQVYHGEPKYSARGEIWVA